MFARLGFSVAADVDLDVLTVDEVPVVAEFCDHCLLLEKGQPVQEGKAYDVISTNLRNPSNHRAADVGSGPIRISYVRPR
jgi:ABC-type polysaccharide/polyol phosphate transport system ATPase subunit